MHTAIREQSDRELTSAFSTTREDHEQVPVHAIATEVHQYPGVIPKSLQPPKAALSRQNLPSHGESAASQQKSVTSQQTMG